MPPEKKTVRLKRMDMFFVLYDAKNSRHMVVSREDLVIGKKKDLKIGVSATLNNKGDQLSHRQWLIIMSGKPCVTQPTKNAEFC